MRQPKRISVLSEIKPNYHKFYDSICKISSKVKMTEIEIRL